MSPDPHASHHAGHAAHDDHAEPHGSMRDYAIGFILSVILTAIPFWLVMARPLPATTTAALVMGFAAVQMIVHMIFFLHMNGKVEGGWTMTALLFTIIIVIIMMSGSLWVMYHLNTNMMPSVHDMRQMP